MCALERAARLGKRGFWATPVDVAAKDAQKLYGKYGFVIGVASRAERVKNKVTVNFGAGRRADFKLVIAAHDLRAFKKQGFDPFSWEGKNLRVRGWVARAFGPAITVTDPHQVELVE